MPWLLNEDVALKYKLQGLYVSDMESRANPGNSKDQFPLALPVGVPYNNASPCHPVAPPMVGCRKVPVRYRSPEDDIADLTFPIIIITFTGMEFAKDRAVQGTNLYLQYAPEGYPGWWDPTADSYDPSQSPYRVDEWPVPYYLNYEVAVYSRLARDHHFPLMARLLQPDMIPARGGFLDIPQDGTFRRLDLMGGPESSYYNLDTPVDDPSQKRLFCSTFSIRVTTELVGDVTYINSGCYPWVNEINIDLSVYRDVRDITTKELTETVALTTGGGISAWNVQPGLQ